MTAELTALILVAIWQYVLVALAGARMNADTGAAYNASPRDGTPPEMSVMTGRLRRTVDNHVENIGLFIIAVVAVQLSDSHSAFTAACAWLYLLARILYLPAYAYGWAPWRSVIWGIGALATLSMLLAALF